MDDIRNAYRILVGKCDGENALGRHQISIEN
jgi:hypothetical protein